LDNARVKEVLEIHSEHVFVIGIFSFSYNARM